MPHLVTIALLATVMALSGCGVPGVTGIPSPASGSDGAAEAPAGDPAASSCGGSHAWPPLDYAERPLPAGVAIVPSGTAVRALNGSTGAWRFETAVWKDVPCVGFLAESPIRSGVIEPGHLVETEFGPLDAPLPGAGRSRMGVAVFTPGCDEACTDPPVGFGWIDVPMAPPGG